MARIVGVSDEDATPEIQAVFDEKRRQNPKGIVPETARIWALWPYIQQAVEQLIKAIRWAAERAGIESDLLYLVYLRVAKLNRDPF